MAFSLGHAADMIARIEQNQALKKDRKYYEVMKRYAGSELNKSFVWKELSDEDRLILVRKINERILAERRKTVVNIGLTLLILSGVMWLASTFLTWLFA